ncbi:hypothetical protein MSAN_00356200 [Mycena sanguinolenta]|uniref:BRCT domain-containing protein n=1 Tax=Mycena sanguinolenta TaxID=230812 RepID=A0A8H7DHN7_9AGAR|nr:hypothetical protein MSAN_00356200 [Mycena sanguinolenta]
MVVGTSSIFRGVVYHIDPLCDDYDLIRFLLEHNGGEEAHGSKDATRIIVDPLDFASFGQVDCKTHNSTVVSPEWVYSSVKCGAKRPSQYYSADPALFFSSAVVSASGLSDVRTQLLRDAVTKYGGQWLPTPTDDVTHLVVDPIMIEPGDDSPGRVLVHANWALHSVVNKVPLPSALYEVTSKPGSKVVSAARRFCEALYFDYEEEEGKLATETSILSDGSIPFLPFEILGKILVEFRDSALCDTSSLTSAVLGVSQVCRYWRNVAHGTGELWTHLRLNFHSKKHYHRLRKLVQQWVVRSHPRTLSFAIRSCYPHAQNPIIQVLLKDASRIRDLSLELPAAHFIPFLQATAGSFPSLENLNMSILSIWDSTYDPESGLSRYQFFEEYDREHPHFENGIPDEEALWGTMAAPMTSLQDAPRLRRIEMFCSYFCTLDPRMFPLNWANLTELDLEFVMLSVEDTAHILPQCTRLRHLKLETDSTPNAIMPPLPRARLPELTVFQWSGFDEDGTSVFEGLSLPGLTDLYLYDGSEGGLQCLYENSSFALRKLYLAESCVHTTFPFLSTFLRSMPSLVSFTAPLSETITDEFLAFLTYDEQHNRILPNLENFDVCHQVQQFSASAVLSMLESRWGTTPLARVKISTRLPEARAPTPADVRSRLIELVEDGLKLVYDCDPTERAIETDDSDSELSSTE